MRVIGLALSAASTILPLRSASAQTPPPAPSVPPALLPDIRLQRLPPPPPPAMAPAPEIETPAPLPSQPPSGTTVRFELTGVTIDGGTVYTQDRLESPFAALIGRRVTLADLYRAAKDVERLYRSDGYFLTRVIVPTQAVDNGRIRVLILEGYVASVRIEGEIGLVDRLVRATLDRITAERPLRFRTLERALLLVDDIPGLSVSGVLRPATDQVGAAELVVTAGRKPFDAALLTDNFGDDFTGRWEMAGSLSSNAWTQLGERITVIGFATDPTTDRNQWVGQATTSWRLGSDGLTLDTVYSYGESNPGSTLEPLDVVSITQLVGGAIAYPVVRSRSLTVNGRLGFEAIDTDVDFFGNEPLSRDRIRVLFFSAAAELRDPVGGANTAELTVRQGLPVFGASQSKDRDTSRPGGTAQATTVIGTVSRLQPLYGNFALYTTMAGQYGFSELLANEEFELGGTQFGRGYDFNTLSGDSGVGGTAELRYTQPLALSFLDRVQVFSFFDGGQVWNRDPAGGDDSLTSTGAGVRLFPIDELFFEVMMAKPLTRDSERSNGQRDPQVLFRAVGRL
jgi:hemolysin activation/secretion protein